MSSATPSTVSLAWDPSHDRVGVNGYGVYLDGRVVATSSQPGATISGLGCGRAYTFGVDAYDAADNHSRRAWATVATAACPDQQAPTAPTGFRQQAAAQNDVVLAWDPSTDDVGVVGYGVYRNGLLQTSTAAPTVTLSGFVCGSAYEVAVDAVDAAGNRSQPRSTWVQTAACSDTQRPAKPILSLGPATQTSLVLNWQPGVDNVGVDHYNVFLNGAKVAQTTGLRWTYTGLACGTDYALGLEVEDAAGNKSLLAEAIWAPVRTSDCSPAPPTADTTRPTQPGSLAVAAATNTSVTLAWTASTDNVGVVGYGVYVNGASTLIKSQPGGTVSGLVCGTAYTLAVDAYDLAGNRSTKASVVGTTAPCADTQAPSAPTNVAVTSRTATSIALSWSPSSDNVGVVGYGLYRGANVTGATAVTTGIFSNLACGSSFSLAVDSYDAAGNRSSRATITASTTACPDTIPPSMPTGLSASNVTGTSLTLGWNASTDNVGVAGYDVYRNGAKTASVPGTSSSQTGLVCGTSHAFAVVSYDAAGNRSSQAQLAAPTAACAAPPPPPPPLPSNWTLCAQENQRCSFAGTAEVRYGANGTFTAPRQFTDGVNCTNAVFGDPIFVVAKHCDYRAPQAAPPSPGGDVYVSPSGSDANACTQAAPCRTFQRGFNVAFPGDVIEVGAGVYPVGTANVSGAAKAVTFKGMPGNKIRHLKSGASSVTYDGLDLDGNGGRPADQMFENFGPNNVTVKNGRIGNIVDGKGAMTNGTNLLFDNVEFHDVIATNSNVHNECLQANWNQGLTIRRSIFRNCATMDASIGYPTWWPTPPPAWDTLTLENNQFYCPRFTNNTGCHAYGLALWQTKQQGGTPEFGYMHNFTIRNNWFESGVMVRPVNDGTSVICGNTGLAPAAWKGPC